MWINSRIECWCQKKYVKNASQGTFSFLSVAVAHMMLAKASFASIPLSLQRSLYVWESSLWLEFGLVQDDTLLGRIRSLANIRWILRSEWTMIKVLQNNSAKVQCWIKTTCWCGHRDLTGLPSISAIGQHVRPKKIPVCWLLFPFGWETAHDLRRERAWQTPTFSVLSAYFQTWHRARVCTHRLVCPMCPAWRVHSHGGDGPSSQGQIDTGELSPWPINIPIPCRSV